LSKYRKIDPRIWNDEHFRPLSDPAKLLFLFLLTHPHLTSLGAMRANPKGLAAELDWTEKDFRKAFAELLRKPFLMVDESASYVGIPNFIKYNQPENPNVLKSWESALDYIPECENKWQLIQDVKAFAEGFGKAFAIALPKAFAKGVRKPLANHEHEHEQEPEPEPNTLMPAGAGNGNGFSVISSQVIDAWNFTNGVRKIRELNLERSKHLKARLKSEKWEYSEALKKFPLQCFKDGGWTPDFDWFIRPDTVNNILEGKYDFTPNNRNGGNYGASQISLIDGDPGSTSEKRNSRGDRLYVPKQ
jgi:hypothetical protein